MSTVRTLEEQRQEFSRGRMLAMPLAGTIAWAVIGIFGPMLEVRQAGLLLYVATGSIAYLGMFLSRFTGEHFLDKSKPKNVFDALFFHGMAQAVLVYAIAIPFAIEVPSSAPLSVGILAGLMWIPVSWIVQHWIGWFHTITRTVLIVLAWYAYPAQRFLTIPWIIVGVYLVTIFVLESRWRRARGAVMAG